METKTCKSSQVISTYLDGRLITQIDDIAVLSAVKHARTGVVTASVDSIEFFSPIIQTDLAYLQSYVCWTGKTSMKIFIKVTAEDLFTGERRIAATAMLTFVALDENNKPMNVPPVKPETEEEKMINEVAEQYSQIGKTRFEASKTLLPYLDTRNRWE
jgi:acyl-CoA hydrolase